MMILSLSLKFPMCARFGLTDDRLSHCPLFPDRSPVGDRRPLRSRAGAHPGTGTKGITQVVKFVKVFNQNFLTTPAGYKSVL